MIGFRASILGSRWVRWSWLMLWAWHLICRRARLLDLETSQELSWRLPKSATTQNTSKTQFMMCLWKQWATDLNLNQRETVKWNQEMVADLGRKEWISKLFKVINLRYKNLLTDKNLPHKTIRPLVQWEKGPTLRIQEISITKTVQRSMIFTALKMSGKSSNL